MANGGGIALGNLLGAGDMIMCTDEFVKWPVVIRIYRSRSWLNNITREL